MRYFNTAGPVNPEDHYCLNPSERINLEEILFLIEQKNILYFMPPDRQVKHPVCSL